jgi:hypothetical protein
MIVTMVNDPLQKRSILLVIMEQDNVQRMEQADPITLESRRAGGVLPAPDFPGDFSLLIAYEPDSAELYKRMAGDRLEFMRWLERGRRWDPEKDGIQNARVIARGKQETNEEEER